MRNGLRPTRIQVPDARRSSLVSLLNQHLANASDLYSQTKQAHWNVKGHDFQQLHELFDTLAGTVLAHADSLAERATALGGTAQGTVRRAARASALPELGDEMMGMELVRLLADRFGGYGNGLRTDAARCEELGDLVTQDLLLELAGEADKSLYFLEAHLVGPDHAGNGMGAGHGRPAVAARGRARRAPRRT